MNLKAAEEYARRHALFALVVMRGESVLLEAYGDAGGCERPHALYSGTKSFWGPLALRAQDDRLLALDEPVAATIAAWRDDPVRRRITLRMLLALTAGYGFGGLGSSVPTYPRALAMPLKHPPGTTFAYGGIALQVFGAVLAAKLAARGLTPQSYLQERLLDQAGVSIAAWRTLPDGTQPLPTGAALDARNWLAYGRFMLRERNGFAACFEGSAANPRYGLGWWLAPPGLPSDTIYASGSGGQGLYLIPSHDLAVLHYGRSASYKHETLLRRLLAA